MSNVHQTTRQISVFVPTTGSRTLSNDKLKSRNYHFIIWPQNQNVNQPTKNNLFLVTNRPQVNISKRHDYIAKLNTSS